MAAVRSLLARPDRLERAKAPALPPFEGACGSLDGFAALVQAKNAGGTLDPRDRPLILNAVQRRHTDRVWDLWQ